MNGMFYIGATGLDAQQRALEALANNVSNINTTGFKRSVVRFGELVTPSLAHPDRPNASAPVASDLAGVAMHDTMQVWEQGAMRQTGNPLDIALDGKGFIELLGPSGSNLVWRGGALKVNADGYLSTVDGIPLRAMISIPLDASAITIARDGKVSVATGDADGPEEIGQIDLVLPKDDQSLTALGNGMYEVGEADMVYSAQPGTDGAGAIVQGAVEGSNVALSDEMVMLLLAQRAFAASAQVVQAGDQLMSIVNGLRR